MDKRKKIILYLLGGAIALIVLMVLFSVITSSQYRSQIPKIPDYQSLSVPVQDQVSNALKSAKRKPSGENLGMLGMVYHSSANYEQAAQCYKLAIKKSQSAWIWSYYLGYLNMEMGESDAVIENFTRVIEQNPEVYHAWYYIGEEYKNLRKNEQAEKSFGKITAIQNHKSAKAKMTRYDYFPLGTYAMFQLARIYFDTGRLDLAEKTLKEIVQNNRSFGAAYRLLGNIYSVRGDMALSSQYGVRANDLLVFSPPVDTLLDRLVLLSRSELYLLKKIDEAEKSIYPEWAMELVGNAINYIPDNKYLISKAIKICLMLNLDQQAIDYADRHIGYFQENFIEMNNMGMLFFQNGLYPQSMKYLSRALNLKPADTEIQKCLAICFWTIGNKQQSIEILDGLLEDYKDDMEVLADLTNLLFDLGEDEKAMVHLSRLERLSPLNPKVQKMAGRIAEKNEKIQEAISMYEASFRGNPEELSTIMLLGNLFIKQKMWDRSIQHFREALEYHPNDPYLLERLGTMLVTCPDPSLRNFKEGRDYSERAFIHTTSRSMILVSSGRSLAIAYSELGDKQDAYKVINMTINIARQENISKANMEELKNLSKRFQASAY